MVGVLLAVGAGALHRTDLEQLLALGSTAQPGSGGGWRGWNVAPARGLTLASVEYPEGVDDPGTRLYPDLPHDEHGRLLLRASRGTGGSGASSWDEE
jgi:hypothetical protein